MGDKEDMMKKIKTALISLFDKSNLKPLLQELKKNNIKIISSGGTFKQIKRLKFKCLEISDFTNFNEILDGRVKTLHPKIHSGILNKRTKKSHLKDMKKNNFENIDLVIANFYPFEKAVELKNNHTTILENIDVGGPTMVRAAAKNYNDVTVITALDQYSELIGELKKNKGCTTLRFREKMSRIAFGETAYYDAVISNYLNNYNNIKFPDRKILYTNLVKNLRYGENPHQVSAFYSQNKKNQIKQIHGKILSYNNYSDIISALTLSKSLPKNTGTVIVKHGNPCGVSAIKNNLESCKLAFESDPISAFGGIVSCNYRVTQKIAFMLNKIFLEVIIANGFDKNALKILKLKKNLRLIDSSKISFNESWKFNSVDNFTLIQSEDKKKFTNKDFKVVSKRKPNKLQLNNLIFAFNVCRYVKSNAIVLANNKSTIGIGSGQPSRLDSCKIAIDKMNKFSKLKQEVVAASDAFFPFVDGIEKLVQSGVIAIIQPAGSIRDKEIIKFANDTNTILVFSKTRHFRH